MSWQRYRAAAATADVWIVEPIRANDRARAVARVMVMAALTAVFAYSGYVSWRVLESLRRVSLADVSLALRYVSVHDAVLCLVAWRIGREILGAITQRRA